MASAAKLDRIVFAESSVTGRVIGSDLLLLVCLCLMIGAGIAILFAIMAKREMRFVANLARRRALRVNDIVHTMGIAEEIIGVGVWRYNPANGTQQWSKGLKRLFGVDETEPFLDGDAETLLFANAIDLVGAVKKRIHERNSYSLEFELFGFDKCVRSIRVEIRNIRDRAGNVKEVIAVARDVTEQVSRERELEYSHAAAVREASRARALAETDPLTGLANRRGVMERLDRMIMDTQKNAGSMILILFDIDHFKSVNDTYGHAEGDRVLKNVATIAAGQARECDIVARVGGEEFVWVVPGAELAAGRILSERLRHEIAQNSATDSVPAVTISAGFACLRSGDSSLSLFARADSALYKAKGDGRNRVHMAV